MRRPREIMWLFLAFFLLYVVSAPGHIHGDSLIRWEISKQIVETGWIDLPRGVTDLHVVGPDGTRYSFFGLGQSVCMAPFVVAGHIAADVLPGGASPDQVGQFLTSIVFFPLCGALAVVLLYSIVLDLTRERRPARWVSILFGVATMHWHCAINTYEASQVAVCLLTCMWASQRAWSRDGLRYPLLAMTAAGIAFFFRISSVVLTGPLLLAVMGADILPRPQVGTRMRRLLRWIGAGLLGVAPFVILVMILNTVRFGHPLTTGYADLVGEWVFNTVTGERVKVQDTPLFEAPLREGLGGLLFSPGKSVFLYNPILLATIPGLILLWRTSRRMTVAVIAMLLTTLLFHGKYLFWTGDWAWGPRYLTEMLAPWMLALIPLLRWRLARGALVALAVVSVTVQVASVTYAFETEFIQHRDHATAPYDWVWRPEESHLLERFHNLARHVSGDPVPAFEDQPGAAPDVNVFPFKRAIRTQSAPVRYGLLAVWIAGVVMLVLVVVRWAWLVRRAEPPEESATVSSA